MNCFEFGEAVDAIMEENIPSPKSYQLISALLMFVDYSKEANE